MGERNKSTKALILNVQASGENNRNVTAFSPDFGIFYLTLFGGPKSKLRALVQTFNSGILYFYEDESKNTRKITDFDVKNFHPSFRENIYKTYAATFANELVLKTKASGDYNSAFKLINGFLDGMELSSEEQCKLGLIRFLWRYLSILGLQPSLPYCQGCSSLLLSKDNPVYFVHGVSGFICKNCYSSLNVENSLFEQKLNSNCITYLCAVNDLSPKEVRNLFLDEESYNQLKEFLFTLIKFSTDSKLNSLDDSLGIL